MALKLSELIEMGYKEQAIALSKQLKKNHQKLQFEQARSWASIGATVNYSFYEVTDKNNFSKKEIHTALLDLGVNMKFVDGKKWYQFWINDDDVKLLNAIKKI